MLFFQTSTSEWNRPLATGIDVSFITRINRMSASSGDVSMTEPLDLIGGFLLMGFDIALLCLWLSIQRGQRDCCRCRENIMVWLAPVTCLRQSCLALDGSNRDLMVSQMIAK